MNSNFHFLLPNWPDVYKQAQEAERHGITAPITSAFYSRLAMELLVNWLYEHDADFIQPTSTGLAARLFEPSFRRQLQPSLLQDLDYIRKVGNRAAHTAKVNSTEAVASLKFFHRFCGWVVRVYLKEAPQIATFDESHIPRQDVAEQSQAELKRLLEENERRIAALEEERLRRMESEAELEKFRKEWTRIQLIKETNKNQPPPPRPFTEEETRKLFIDVLLRDAGWDPAAPNVYEYPLRGIPTPVNPSGSGKADYVLWGKDALPLAVIEAKRTSRDVEEGRTQAEVYADALEQMHGRRPVIFYTNGFKTFLWDDQFYPPREVQGFYTLDELEFLIQRRKSRNDIRGHKADPQIVNRHYQLEAVKRVAEAFADEVGGKLAGRKRAALIVMATGAGKTRTAAAIVDMLVKNGWVKRALFLADRTALVTQAQDAFKGLLPHLSSIDLTKEKEEDTTRLVFSTYPTMLNRIDNLRTGDNRFYGVGHFDLIIVDEAHRSVYQKYQAIFRYFDALMLGLTATPRDEADRDTYELFECELHVPTYFYELDQAVQDKFLVPPKGKEFNLGFLRRGIRYQDLSEEEKAEYEATFRDESGGIPQEIHVKAINEWLFNKDTIDQALNLLMTHGLKVEGGDKLGKTIIFARNHRHAEKIVERFDRQYPQLKGKFCKVIDTYDRFAQKTFEDFKQSGKFPQIAVSVDMLDTGVDIPEILNLVFFKPVYSSAKYWQMIGRGTRLRPDLFGPGQHKEHFLVFDFCGNFDFFDHHPDGLTHQLPLSLSSRLFMAWLELAQLIYRKQLFALHEYRMELLDACHQEVESLFALRDNIQIRQVLEYINQYRDRSRWGLLSYEEENEIRQYLAPLVVLKEEDEAAKRFDLLLLQIQLGKLNEDGTDQAGWKQVQLLAFQLLQLQNIPVVRQQKDLLKQILSDTAIPAQDMEELEAVREGLRSLIRLIPSKKRRIFDTNFADQLEGFKDRDLLGGYARTESYRKRVERLVEENRNHIAIHKLRNNVPLAPAEVEELERMLFAGEGKDAREKFKAELNGQTLGQFIRSLVGLDTNAAKIAFAEFLNRTNLNANQITFINQVIDYLTCNGIIEKRLLAEPPFTDLHHHGIFGLFGEDDQFRIIQIIDGINGNARLAP